MRILFVAMPNSIHTVRWIHQIVDQGWDIHILSSIMSDVIHPAFHDVTVHHDFWGKVSIQEKREDNRHFPFIFKLGREVTRRAFKTCFQTHSAVSRLNRLIRRLKPDLIHSLEFQAAGYLVAEAKKRFHGKFPPWIATNWGSDLYLFGRLAKHESKVREVLALCDYYSCECQRDVGLAQQYGLKGSFLPVFPNTGGYDLESVSQLRNPGPIASRRTIMLKGYQHWAGRALVGLRALERCADILKGYTVVLYSTCTEDVLIAAELFEKSTGVAVKCIPLDTPHRDILRLHGQARISLGLSISDAISTSLLEALVMGSFPIQSWTACANEWVVDGETGFLVPPEDPDIIERAIRRALTEDDLVNRAAVKNYALAAERLDHAVLKPKATDIYTRVAKEKGISYGN